MSFQASDNVQLITDDKITVFNILNSTGITISGFEIHNDNGNQCFLIEESILLYRITRLMLFLLEYLFLAMII